MRAASSSFDLASVLGRDGTGKLLANAPLLGRKFYADAEIQWLNPAGGLPDWFDPKEKKLACLIQENGQGALFLMFNAGTNGTDFGLPPLPQGFRWHVAVDTSRLAPARLVRRRGGSACG
jgi:pullulanase/glycogen debranching enzyme